MVTLQRLVSVDVERAILVHCKVLEALTDVIPVDRGLDGGLDDFDWVREEGDVACFVVLAVVGVGDDVFGAVEQYYDWVIYVSFLTDSRDDTCAVDCAPDFLIDFEHG